MAAVKVVKVRYGEKENAVYACDDVGLAQMDSRFMGLKNVRMMMEDTVTTGSKLRLTEYSSFAECGHEIVDLNQGNIANAMVVPIMQKIQYYEPLSDFIMVKCTDIEYMSMNATNPKWFQNKADAIFQAKLNPIPTLSKHDMFVREVFKTIWSSWFIRRRAKLERMRELMQNWKAMNFCTIVPAIEIMHDVIGERLPA